MKVAFISNYFNHHQAPFCNEMFSLLGDDFVFIETEAMEEERAQMGWGITKYPSYVKKAYSSSDEEDKCLRLIDEADAAILGSAPERFIRNRLKNSKLIIRYSERPLENGVEILKHPYRWIKWHKKAPSKKPVYMLCASAYTSSDLKKLGVLKGRCYKWGYFPPTYKYDSIETIINKKKPASILWVSRFIELKHPEIPIYLAKKLKESNYDFSIKMIGIGEMQEKIKGLISSLNVEDRIEIMGSMGPEQVRREMEQSELFLFTSDHREGWGAVLNESMNSGCAVVANKEIGSVPYLIKDGVNGLVYEFKDINNIYEKVTFLLDKPAERKKISLNAYNTIIEDWNAENAAHRLLIIIEDLLNNKWLSCYPEGPCSMA